MTHYLSKTLLLFVAALPGLLSTLSVSAAGDFKPASDATEKIEALLVDEIPWQGLTPAYTIVADVGGRTVYEKHIGLADLENRVVPTADTVYQVGSISKSYTALAILQLVEKGEIDLDGSVKGYLPEYSGPGGEATVRQLLTHTSGIPNYTGLPEAREMLTWVPTTREDIVALVEDKSLDFEPGTNFAYSNTGYYLLGLIVEAVTEEDFYEYLGTHVFEPLGLQHTYSGRYEELVPNRASGYNITPDGFLNAPPTPNLTPFAAGSIQTTARDLIAYRRGVFRSDVVSKRVLKLIRTTQAFGDGTQQDYALGALTRGENQGHEKWGHSGGISGFITHHDYYPELDMTVVVLTNTGNPPVRPDLIARQVATLLLGEEVEKDTRETVTLEEETLRRYTGEYLMSPFRLTGDGILTLLMKDGALFARLGASDAEQAPVFPLQPVAEDTFRMAGPLDLDIAVVKQGDRVTGLEIVRDGRVWPAQRRQ